MMLRKINNIILCIVLGLSFSAYSQNYTQYEASYQKAKLLFDTKRFDEAITGFENLSTESDNNPFAPYARFYKAKSYLELGQYPEARFVLVRLTKDFPKWTKIDDVNYLLGYTQLLSDQYSQAKTSINKIENESLLEKGESMYYSFVASEDSSVLINELQYKTKDDKQLVDVLTRKLQYSKDSSDIFFLNYLIQEYDLAPQDFGLKAGVKKEKYQIALLLPLSLKKSNAYLNIKILDLLKGVQLAVDSLNSLGKNIELQVYDTERSLVKINNILKSNTFKNVDLILGPLEQNACKLLADYAEENKIVNFNFSRQDTVFSDKSFVFSSISSQGTVGRQLANTAFNSFDTTKSVRIYYHDSKNKQDSIMASNYKSEIEKLGMNVPVFMGVKRDMSSYKQSLQWSKEDGTSHVVVFAHKHNLMASTLISIWEGSNKKIPVVAPKEWLDIHLIGYDQFERRNIHFMYSEFIPLDNVNVNSIKKTYYNEFGVRPSSLKYLAVGYDVTFFVGNQLHEKGTFFHQNISEVDDQSAVLTTGLDFSKGKTNANVPLLKFDEEFEFINVSQLKN